MAEPAVDPLVAALDPGRSVVVTASAGSGKTWLLTSRVLRLLLEGHNPGSILALTFTRKAAAEMGERINQRLHALAYGDAAAVETELERLGLTPEPQTLLRARRLYETLLFSPYPPRAMTLHAFCQDVLSRFALEAGIPPGFALIEAEGALQRRAWRQVLANAHRFPQSPEAQALRDLIELGCSERRLESLVYGFLGRRADWWAYVEDGGAGPDSVDAEIALAQSRLHTALQQSSGGAATLAATADHAAELDGDAFTARLRILWRWIDRVGGLPSIRSDGIEAALSLVGDQRFAMLIEALFTQAGEPYKFRLAKAKRAALSEDEAGHFEFTHGEIVASVQQARDSRNRQACVKRTVAALQLGTATLAELRRELVFARALSFADLEWQAYRLLRQPDGAEWVRCKLDQKIDHLLIDEFQDTNPTQWRMLLPLLEEMAAGDAGHARSVFIVGDVKQSIYGFRRAEPELMDTARRWMSASLHALTVPLNASRRSAPAIIDFVNALFEQTDLGTAIGFVRHSTFRSEDWGRIEVAPPIERGPRPNAAENGTQPMRNPLTTPREVDEETRAQREGRQVAERIRTLIASRIAVRGDAGERAIHYGDVMILARSRTHLRAIEQALTEARIPYVGSSRGSLLDTAEASDLVALLRFLDAPHRNLELAHVLRSPLFAASDDDLVALANRSSSVEHGPPVWFDLLDDVAVGRPALQRASTLLRAWLPLATRLPAHDLLDRIFAEADAANRYEAALPAVPAARVRANLGAFIQLALEADSGRYPTLAGFIDYVGEMDRGGIVAADAPDESPPPAAGAQVRVMTIHAAKGLEAAAVFLVNAGRVAVSRTPRWLIEWPAGAERPSHFLATGDAGEREPLSEELATLQRRREAREDLNLLYVAVTRARQFLHVSGFRASQAGDRSCWHDHAVQALERLAGNTAQPLAGAAPATMHYGSGEVRHSFAAKTAASEPIADPRLQAPIPGRTAPAGDPHAPTGDEPFDAEAARRGSAIHRLLQMLSSGETTDETRLRRRLEAQLGETVDDAEFAAWLQAATAVVTAPSLALFFDRTRYQRAWNEVPFSDGGRDGAIDRLVDDGTTLWILDYKTDALSDSGTLITRHRPQLSRYAAAIGRIWSDRQVRCGLVAVQTRAWVEVTGLDRVQPDAG
jgi:ATP-dependent helicase/nuclease subunit A